MPQLAKEQKKSRTYFLSTASFTYSVKLNLELNYKLYKTTIEASQLHKLLYKIRAKHNGLTVKLKVKS